MRLCLVGQRGPYSIPALRALVAHPGVNIVAVVQGLPKQPAWQQHRWARQQVSKVSDGASLQQWANHWGIPCLLTRDINAPRACRLIKDLRADVLACVGFDRLFGPKLLEVVRYPLNAHPSLLPKWRGPAPLFWQAKSGDRKLGMSIHRLSDKEDGGPIWVQRSLDYLPGMRADTVLTRLGELAGACLVQAIERIEQGQVVEKPQAKGEVTWPRARRPQAEDAQFEPEQWLIEDLRYFCDVAPFHRAPWVRLGDEIFFIRHTLRILPGEKIPGHYSLVGDRLLVNAKDGVVELAVQK